VAAKAVVQNPTKNGAGYMTRTQLAEKAKGIHNDKPYVLFTAAIGSPNTLQVNVDASSSTCSGSAANCDAYDWDWGDGTGHGSGVTTNHVYASAGAKSIVLTVEQFSVGGASATRSVTVSTPDLPPTAAGTCAFDANTWTETVTDASTDDNGVKQITVNWGDGSVLFSDTAAPFGPAAHTYLNPGSYTVTHKAVDTIGQIGTRTCVANPAYFHIAGTVNTPAGPGHPLAGATVTIKKGTTVVGLAYSLQNGGFSAGNLKPGTYTVNVTRSGYTFTIPAATITVGPDSNGNAITALTGALLAPQAPKPESTKGKHHGGKPDAGGGVTPTPR
jgi:PKD repeat protein